MEYIKYEKNQRKKANQSENKLEAEEKLDEDDLPPRLQDQFVIR